MIVLLSRAEKLSLDNCPDGAQGATLALFSVRISGLAAGELRLWQSR
jgi:hypothetical protein